MNIVTLAFIAVVGWAAYRYLTKEQQRVSDKLEEAEDKMAMDNKSEPLDSGNLRKDPDSGIYKPKKD